jgi:hypothetical protein
MIIVLLSFYNYHFNIVSSSLDYSHWLTYHVSKVIVIQF